MPAATAVIDNSAKIPVFGKNKVEKEVLDTIIDGLNAGEIDSKKAQDIARDTLSTLKIIDEHEQSIELFYKNLAQKHPMFNFLYTKVKAEGAKTKELSAHRQALTAINAGEIDQAKNIALGAMAETAHEKTNLK